MRQAKIYILLGLCVLCTHLLAVPAYPDWITMEQPDGSLIDIRAVGDEFYHYWINIDGQEVIQDETGWWIVAPEQATSAQRKARRAASPMLQEVAELRKAPVSPMPTKMLVILVSFSDRAILSSHDNAYFDNWLNGQDNQPYGSAWEYFHTTSDGKYSPHWDVYGPVVLDSTMAYYGGNDSNKDDLRPRQMAFEACEKADALGCDFSQYDANNDGTVDNVYIIYAGYAESSCSSSWPNAIWPHSWSMGVYATHTIDGKKLSKYGCSAELDNCSGDTPDGIGTFCHEFSHVIGMPDYYDTKYGENYKQNRTPGRWSLMDHGSYNGNGCRPPLYSIFDKCYMGWASMPPVLPQNAKVTVSMPVGTQYARHISGTTSARNYTYTDTVYYLETRQQTGKFDYSLPGQGLIIWQVKYRSNWSTPNNDAGVLRYTLLSATGSTDNLGTSKDAYPGANKVTTKTVWPGCELSAISYSDGTATFKYNGGVPSLITIKESFQMAPGQTYTWRGRVLDTPGTYSDTIRSEFDDTAYVFTLSYVDPVKAIIYTAPNKLEEIGSYDVLGWIPGLHTSAFDQSIALHYFANGTGLLLFNDTIRTIDQKAFYFCKKITTLILPESLTQLGKHALQDCIGLTAITCEALTPPGCYSSTFSGLTRSKIALNAWPASLGTYKTTDEWKKFFIQAISCGEPDVNITTDTICHGDTYRYKGDSYNTSTTLSDTTWNQYGCATTIDRLELTAMPHYSYIDSVLICPDTMYIWHNQVISETGTYYDSAQTIYGCDSVYTLHLRVMESAVADTISKTICENDTYTWQDKQLSIAGLYADTLLSQFGCDSVIHYLNLTTASRYTYSDSATICQSESYVWHNQSLTETGTYYDSLQTQYGCDSVYTLMLQVAMPTVVDYPQRDTILAGNYVEWRGIYYSEEGIYTDTAFNAQSCELEVYTLELNVTPTISTWMDQTTTNKSSNSANKYILRNQLYIERNGIRYNAMGQRINN